MAGRGGRSATKQRARSASSTSDMLKRRHKQNKRGRDFEELATPGLIQLSVEGTGKSKQKAKALLLLLRDCSGKAKEKPSQNCLVI
ncbi:unnamed protein product [Ilex paraguariensis]|uniref:Uncharacterized protein n=1 Tax=Ilex paraguariensis TaxID=185542 RepID=A0ABC8SPP4_9AQUA